MTIQPKSVLEHTLLPRTGKIFNIITARVKWNGINSIRKSCRRKMKIFDGLHSLNHETKKQIRSKVMHSYIESFTSTFYIISEIAYTILILILSLIFINMYLVFYIYSSIYHTSNSINVFSSFAVSFISLFLLPLLAKFTLKINKFLYGVLIICGFPILMIFISYSIIHSEFLIINFNELASIALLFITAIFLVSCELLIINSLIILTLIRVDNIERSKFPVSFIIEKLVSILAAAEKNRHNLVNLSHKRIQLSRLEIVARQIEYYMPRQLRGGDFITDTWTRETFRQIATSIRNKKKWIITPKSDTNDYFIKSIADILLSIVNDDWDSLDQMDNKQLSRPQFRHLLIGVMRTVLIAIIPLIALLIFQLTPFALKGAAFQYISIGTYVWIVLVLIVALDPTLNTKIETFKNIRSILSPPN